MSVPEYLQKTRVRLAELSPGVQGIRDTLGLMVGLCKEGRRNYTLRKLASQIVGDLPGKAYRAEARAMQEYVRDHIRYVRDIRDVETVSTPEMTLDAMCGDCDDKALLVATLLECIGHPCRFVAVGYTENDYCHVLAEVRVGGAWVAVETTENVPLGWYPPNMPARMVYHV
jgi:transglutaminase-like putative cysteine protease